MTDGAPGPTPRDKSPRQRPFADAGTSGHTPWLAWEAVSSLDRMIPPDFRSQVHGPLRRLYITTLINCVGNGMAFSMFVVYLHNVRGFSTTFSTVLLTVTAIVGLALSPLGGTLIDRWGPGVVGVTSYTLSALGLVLWTTVHTKPTAIIVALVITLFQGAGWGPGMVMMTRLVDEDHRARAYGLNFMIVNIGIGCGLLISASVVSLQHPGSFTVLYLGDALVTLVAAAIFATILPHGKPIHVDHHSHVAHEGWGVVVRDRRLRLYVVASVVLLMGGYGSVDAGLSLFVVNNLHVSVHVIGIAFFVNTVTVVAGQMWILNKVQGRSRSRTMALVGVLWFVFWVALETALALPFVFVVVTLCASQVLFAVGETMLQPTGMAIINEIAPEHLRGRYNAAGSAAWGLSGTLAPAITGLYYSVHLGDWWPLGTGVLALVGGAMMLSLRRSLSASEDGRVPLETAS